jgi:hypothetical protein
VDKATHGKFAGRSSLPITGPPQFRESVERVLKELREEAPHRYREVLGYLPKAEYAPGNPFAGRSDGLFTIDGGGDIPMGNGHHRANSYEYFRFVFLHEVGHNIAMQQKNDSSEEAANAYADKVVKEVNK